MKQEKAEEEHLVLERKEGENKRELKCLQVDLNFSNCLGGKKDST